jgi:ribonuclease BN (tRNA processing enzyme)
MKLQVRVNGVQAAWPALYGCDNAHANEVRDDPYRVANASFSLVQWDGDKVARHTLIDLGCGVMQSLIEFERTHKVRVVHELLLTHPHFDHFAHLDWLVHSIQMVNRPDQPAPLPVFATLPGWYVGPSRVFPYLQEHEQAEHQPVVPGEPFELGALRITPVAVEHSPTAPGAVGYVVQTTSSSDADEPKKIVFTGDFLRAANEEDPIWRDADVCFMESNTWNPNPETHHQSILDGLRLARVWNVRRLYLVHYAGFQDAKHADAKVNRALTYAELADAARAEGPDVDVRVATHGLLIPDDEAWPGR